MAEDWDENSNEELSHLQEDRQYVIFVPNEEDEATFSVMVADTFSNDPSKQESHIERFNVSSLVIKGIMYMLDSELEYLVKKGEEYVRYENKESAKILFKNSENVIVFDPERKNT